MTTLLWAVGYFFLFIIVMGFGCTALLFFFITMFLRLTNKPLSARFRSENKGNSRKRYSRGSSGREDCPECMGVGVVGDDGTACPTCGGSGRNESI